jgi:hypothetical protein
MAVITDWGTAIWTSLTGALVLAFGFIPKLIGFLLILLVGWFVAGALEKGILWLLRRVGFENFSNRIGLGRLQQRMNIPMGAEGLIGKIVFWFIFLIFLIPAVEALGLTTVSNLLNQIIDYIPNVLVAILVLFLGTLLATFISDIIRGAMGGTTIGNANVYANIARYAILGFAGLIALYQLQIAPAIIQTLFTAIVGALALAFGLAFGLGGREAAQRWLARGETSLANAAAQISAQQSLNQARAEAERQHLELQRQEQARIAEQQRLDQARYVEQQRMGQGRYGEQPLANSAQMPAVNDETLAHPQYPQQPPPRYPKQEYSQQQQQFPEQGYPQQPQPPQFPEQGYPQQQPPFPKRPYNPDQPTGGNPPYKP